MKVPVHRLKKAEMVWLGTHRCKHGVTYLEHYNCYLREHVDKQEVEGYLDIETTNLKASYGIMLCWCIYDANNDVMYEGRITAKDLGSEDLDKRITQELIDTLRKFDRVYTYYGTKFDLPFVRTRAVVHGLDFPIFQSLYHKDVYYIVRNKFCLHSNKLVVACEVLLGKSDKTRITPDYWTRALMGHEDSLNYILQHCRYDVTDLAKLHRLVEDYAGRPNTSI
jgi:uncharacterized protein YprB with RNaseH-like and TPR domain